MQLQTGEPLYQIMLARYYGDSLPRFLSPDPIGGSPSRPQSWNRYSYVLGNPMRLVDPTGMYGINPNPYNPGGSNPCDGRGPMCFQVDPATSDPKDRRKAMKLEQDMSDYYQNNTAKFEEVYGAWGVSPGKLKNWFEPGRVCDS